MTTRDFSKNGGLTSEEMARLEARDPMLAAAYRDGRIIDGAAWMKADAEEDRLVLEYEKREAGEWGAENVQSCGID